MQFIWQKFAPLSQTAVRASFSAKPVLPYGIPSHMSAWQCLNFVSSNTEDLTRELKYTTTRLVPTLTRPDQVLIKVDLATLNPVDLLSLRGYGSSAYWYAQKFGSSFGLLGFADRNATIGSCDSAFPLTPGRDFVGTVVDMGPSVHGDPNNRLTIGQMVAGATWPFLSAVGSGSLADYIVCPSGYLAALPENLDPFEAAAVGYAGLTAWSALVSGGLSPRSESLSNSKFSDVPLVLVAGATGGVGIIAAQLAKLWGSRVHVICRDDDRSLQMMTEMGVDEVIVHPDKPGLDVRYDVIIDCIRPPELSNLDRGMDLIGSAYPRLPRFFDYLKLGSKSRYVSVNPPLLHMMDKLGVLVGGGVAAANLLGSQLLACNFCRDFNRGQVRWAFFQPDAKRLTYMLKRLSEGRMKVFVDSTYSFSHTPEAFTRLQARGTRGKVIVHVSDKS
ncbi:unnamed protein product [Calicophoron daubneyi]|uniref:Enoyl reductase (ER) domain-containing protein n=1 Tax=Calicophoron daubneyi TaxID=300641 RepID=A0AAV2T7Q2_CALDB